MPTISPGYRHRRTAVLRGGHPVYRPNPAIFGAAAVSILIWAALIELFI